MKLKYLDQKWNYKPEYDIQDFVRVNYIETYDTGKILKLMKQLYTLRLYENRWEYADNDFLYDTLEEEKKAFIS